MQFPISIELRRSYLLFSVLLIVHAGAAACATILPWHWAPRAALVAVIAHSLFRALRPPRIVGLILRDKKRFEGRLANGECAELEIASDSAVFRRLIVLRLRVGDDKRVSALPVLADQMPAEQFRRLRLWLRWRAHAKPGERF
jgi:toxin CptA